MLHPRQLVLTLLVLGSALVGPVKPHEESGKWSCESESEGRVPAQYRPGVVTLDGHADDWKDVNGFEFSLLPALDPDAENAYTGGTMTVKALHDGKDMYFMVQVKGDYVYSKGGWDSGAVSERISRWKCQYLTKGEQTHSHEKHSGWHGNGDGEFSGRSFHVITARGQLYGCLGYICKSKRKKRAWIIALIYASCGACGAEDLMNGNKCPSVALMFQVGDNASYHNMGGCKASPGTCTSKSCHGYEVDIMHFSIGNAVPGRLYGGNTLDNAEGYGGDRYGHLVDVYAWNPHCRYLDGMSPSGNDSSAQNDWKGAWWHDSFTTHSGFVEGDSPYATSGQKGTYYFEFSRPLRTMDRLQQDVQFSIGQSSKFSAAFWYPVDGNPWHGSGHFTVGCDWVLLDISSGSSALLKTASENSWDAASAFALLVSVVSLCLSVFVIYRAIKSKDNNFSPIINSL
ncbi:hypothetical protein RHSIM_Rhsim11G0096600 [Rhododendron simsii]|uniref:Cytochrome c-552/DMSO reductase-like haem-binding domain-containing protein n=1 Tax=Rhododendron simsii TaxID=118357 RepID=A0A834L8F2_RHOSS|nr:hypothetical protein RHSIM_Rhsim11G0096600 [Rhododendron simsii]